jgi:hypothetical protein
MAFRRYVRPVHGSFAAAAGCLVLLSACGGSHATSEPLVTSAVTAQLVGGPRVQQSSNATITGLVTPASAGRAVVLQRSTGSGGWTAIAHASTTATGSFDLDMPTGVIGPITVRVQVPATTTQAASTSRDVSADVEDFTGARDAYIACVTPGAKADDAVSNAIDASNAGKLTFAQLKRKDAALSQAYHREITCLSGRTWPPGTSDTVRDVETQDAVLAACEAVTARAATTYAYNHACQTPAAKTAYAALDKDDKTLDTTMLPS